jgi:hypothetical protein
VAKKIDDVVLEDVRLVFKNFEGREEKYNTKGNRNFAVVLNDEQADAMLAEGWNVKRKPPKEEGEDNFNYLSVAVSFRYRPPRLILISEVPDGEGNMVKKRTQLDEDTCEMLDYVDASEIDLILNPSRWHHASGTSGVKAYLNAIYVTLNTDALMRKYAHIPDANGPLAIESGSQRPELESGNQTPSDDDVIDLTEDDYVED